MMRFLRDYFYPASKIPIWAISPLVVFVLSDFFIRQQYSNLVLLFSFNPPLWIYRIKPIVILVIPIFVSFFIILFVPRFQRHIIAKSTLFIIFVSVFLQFSAEFNRLTPYLGKAGFGFINLLGFVDLYLWIGCLVSIVLLRALFKRSSWQKENFTRSQISGLGDADWMGLTQAGRILPATGGIVIGERYRPDLDHTAMVQFNPKDKSTWGRGGKEPLLTFNADFGSTHMLFFAGAGGYKSTGTVIPTALRWNKPLVVLDPSNEIAGR